MTNLETVLEARELTKLYPRGGALGGLLARAGGWEPAGTWALRDVSFRVPRGAVVGLLGPNGAGKTTLLKCMLGLLDPTRGAALALGEPADGDNPGIRAHIGVLIGRPAAYPYLTGRRNLELRARFLPGARARIDGLLARVGLAAAGDERVSRYSTGMKQRLGLAASLLGDPEILVLDEPTSGLDPAGQKEVRDLIRESAREKGCTVLVSSHLLAEIESVCDHVLVLSRGELKASGPVKELLGQETEEVRVVTDRPAEARDVVERLDGDLVVELADDPVEDRVLRVTGPPGLAPRLARALLEAGHELRALVPHRRTLEEFFLEAVQEPARSPGGDSGSPDDEEEPA